MLALAVQTRAAWRLPRFTRYHTIMLRLLTLAVVLCGGLMANSDFDQAQAARFAALALDCVHKPYPNKIAHSLNSDADVKPPRELPPAFYGCYDWHSSVHGPWLLVRRMPVVAAVERRGQ